MLKIEKIKSNQMLSCVRHESGLASHDCPNLYATDDPAVVKYHNKVADTAMSGVVPEAELGGVQSSRVVHDPDLVTKHSSRVAQRCATAVQIIACTKTV